MTCYSPGISLWFLIWFLGWTEAPESASSFDQQLQSVNMYASIKNMRSFQEGPKSFFLAKCLSSLYGIGTVRYKTPSSKLILNGDCVYSAKTWSCEVVGCHQISECNHILCCVWEAPLFWLLIQHLMASGTFFEFVVVNLLGLGTILVLPLTRFYCWSCTGKFQAVLSISPSWTQISTANAAARELYASLGQLVTRCHRLSWS